MVVVVELVGQRDYPSVVAVVPQAGQIGLRSVVAVVPWTGRTNPHLVVAAVPWTGRTDPRLVVAAVDWLVQIDPHRVVAAVDLLVQINLRLAAAVEAGQTNHQPVVAVEFLQINLLFVSAQSMVAGRPQISNLLEACLHQTGKYWQNCSKTCQKLRCYSMVILRVNVIMKKSAVHTLLQTP